MICISAGSLRAEAWASGLFRWFVSIAWKSGYPNSSAAAMPTTPPAIAFYRHMGGIQGDDFPQDVPKEDQIIHFEFYIGD